MALAILGISFVLLLYAKTKKYKEQALSKEDRKKRLREQNNHSERRVKSTQNSESKPAQARVRKTPQAKNDDEEAERIKKEALRERREQRKRRSSNQDFFSPDFDIEKNIDDEDDTIIDEDFEDIAIFNKNRVKNKERRVKKEASENNKIRKEKENVASEKKAKETRKASENIPKKATFAESNASANDDDLVKKKYDSFYENPKSLLHRNDYYYETSKRRHEELDQNFVNDKDYKPLPNHYTQSLPENLDELVLQEAEQKKKEEEKLKRQKERQEALRIKKQQELERKLKEEQEEKELKNRANINADDAMTYTKNIETYKISGSLDSVGTERIYVNDDSEVSEIVGNVTGDTSILAEEFVKNMNILHDKARNIERQKERDEDGQSVKKPSVVKYAGKNHTLTTELELDKFLEKMRQEQQEAVYDESEQIKIATRLDENFIETDDEAYEELFAQIKKDDKKVSDFAQNIHANLKNTLENKAVATSDIPVISNEIVLTDEEGEQVDNIVDDYIKTTIEFNNITDELIAKKLEQNQEKTEDEEQEKLENFVQDVDNELTLEQLEENEEDKILSETETKEEEKAQENEEISIENESEEIAEETIADEVEIIDENAKLSENDSIEAEIDEEAEDKEVEASIIDDTYDIGENDNNSVIIAPASIENIDINAKEDEEFSNISYGSDDTVIFDESESLAKTLENEETKKTLEQSSDDDLSQNSDETSDTAKESVITEETSINQENGDESESLAEIIETSENIEVEDREEKLVLADETINEALSEKLEENELESANEDIAEISAEEEIEASASKNDIENDEIAIIANKIQGFSEEISEDEKASDNEENSQNVGVILLGTSDNENANVAKEEAENTSEDEEKIAEEIEATKLEETSKSADIAEISQNSDDAIEFKNAKETDNEIRLDSAIDFEFDFEADEEPSDEAFVNPSFNLVSFEASEEEQKEADIDLSDLGALSFDTPNPIIKGTEAVDFNMYDDSDEEMVESSEETKKSQNSALENNDNLDKEQGAKVVLSPVLIEKANALVSENSDKNSENAEKADFDKEEKTLEEVSENEDSSNENASNDDKDELLDISSDEDDTKFQDIKEEEKTQNDDKASTFSQFDTYSTISYSVSKLENELEKIETEDESKSYTKEFEAVKEYVKPSFEFLSAVEINDEHDEKDILEERGQLLIDTLKSFGVTATMTHITCGPAVTRFEIQPASGIKISKITALSDDIAMNLAASGVRIEAPIPGKPAVGIEIPNKTVKAVKMREVIDSSEFIEAKSAISMGLGKDISGKIVVADLGKMPHMLIAGSTGSGKSVCINSIIVSLLYKSSPSDVKMIMIDPKVVELGMYNGIPHLLIPVVTEPKKAASALNWAVREMLLRYNLFAENSVRDLNSYNKLMVSRGENKLPNIVIIIDELADLMMAAPNEVEDSICRLAQMARAAGMHLIIATQRPSVDVITGVIKANIPSRIAFAVSSQVDSRTILDQSGAENLLGRGDMLFSPIGERKPLRVQGCFVTDEEIEKIVDFVKSNNEPSYNERIISEIDSNTAKDSEQKQDSDDTDEDPLLMEAIKCVVDAGSGSSSFLQRKLRLGFSRAARLIDTMEELGIVGPQEGASKPRKVLITKEQALEMEFNRNANKLSDE